jgi:hypothetical protein
VTRAPVGKLPANLERQIGKDMKSTRLICQVSGALIAAFAIFPCASSGQTSGQSALPRIGESDRHRAESEADLERRAWNLRLLSEQARKPGPKQPTV